MDVILDQARLLLDQGRPRDAEAKLRVFLQEEPDNDFALSLLARCYYSLKDFNKGIATIREAIRRNPEESFYHYLQGFGYYQLDYLDLAKADLTTAIQLNPWHAEYYGLLAYCLLGEKNFTAALEKANEGLAIDASSLTCLNVRSMALNKLKRTDEAIATMQDALAQDPDSEFTHNTIGWNLLERGRHNDAAHHFREALRINPVMSSSQSGLKEALKSKVPPYKWLLQYSFWVNNRGKKLKTAMPFILYFSFRALLILFQHSNTDWLVGVLLCIYLLFVVGSWTMNSIANFFLLFHPDGKYALSKTESTAAVLVVTAMLVGFALLGVDMLAHPVQPWDSVIFGAGLICISLALPLGELDYPINLKKGGKRNMFSALVAGAGLLALLLGILFPEQALTIMGIYAASFLIYNWSGVLRY
jgi:tetratricopeptide (TPR) repeat protein